MAGDGTLIIEDAELLFRNFEGREAQYNRAGERNFCIKLTEDLVEQMEPDGWNIKRLKPRDDEEIGAAYIQVSVGYKGRPPRIILITSKGRVDLGQHECELLDIVEIAIADVIIRPYHWAVSGNTGVKAYLKTLAVTVNEDFLELKYNEVPEIGETGVGNSIEATEHLLALEQAGKGDQDPNEGMDVVDAHIVEDE